jgi:uncharacterized RDD family membrane protein YckC
MSKKSNLESPARERAGDFNNEREQEQEREQERKREQELDYVAQKGYMRKRVIALLADALAIMLLCQFLFMLTGAPDWPRYFGMQDAVKGLGKTDPLVVGRSELFQQCQHISLAVGAAYEALSLVLFRATLGKLAFGMRVVDVEAGRNPIVSRLMLAIRAVAKMASVYLLFPFVSAFLCLTALGNPGKRSGFDMIAGTKVTIKKEEA